MATIANLVAFDGAATPVSHTFVPVSVTRENGTVSALWREQTASLPVYAQATVLAKSQRLPSGVYRVSIRVEVPVMEAVTNQNAAGYTAAPKVAYVNTVENVSYFHERSTITERRLARMLIVNLGNNVTTTVAAATAGMLPDAVDALVMPT